MVRTLTVVACSLISLAQWPIDRLEPSLARMDMAIDQPDGTVSTGTCTAFAIRTTPPRWITAAHCTVDRDITLNGLPVEPIFVEQRDPALDLAVVTVNSRGDVAPPAPRALKLGNAPRKGDAVVALGFGAGAPQSLFFTGQILSPDLPLPTFGPTRPALFLNFVTLKGMSGGPVVDRDRRVVGVIMGGLTDEPAPGVSVSMPMSYSPPWERLRELYRTFGS